MELLLTFLTVSSALNIKPICGYFGSIVHLFCEVGFQHLDRPGRKEGKVEDIFDVLKTQAADVFLSQNMGDSLELPIQTSIYFLYGRSCANCKI